MDTGILRKLGLESNEVKAYLGLLYIGQTTTGPLVKKSGIPSSKIYHVLDSLVSKGIVSYIVKGKVKWFRANRPVVLRHLLDLKEQELSKTKQELENALPGLEAEFEQEKHEYSVEILEGLRGIKSLYDQALELCKKGETLYTIGYPKLASELLNAYFKYYHKQLAKKGLAAKVIYDYDTWFSKNREIRPHAEQRYLPKGMHTPAFINIFRDYVGIMVITEQQKTCIVIKNKEVAESYLQYFRLLWAVARKT